ncbi:hypothetical protein ACFQ1O_06955 [Pseudofulvibacter geojedonensis]|uniref:Anti-sigma factor n=2 Tax=Pseudofulvibacter geojedonensis TaxID=1123758 RepID=A0ABW3I238_9FLAO
MLKDNKHIQDFFQEGIEHLNTREMSKNHELRFLEKLEKNKKKKTNKFRYLSLAASVVLLLGFFVFKNTNGFREVEEPNSFPQEVVEAHQYYDGIIMKQLVKLESFINEDNSVLIADTVAELKKLKTEEEELLTQLENNYNERIIKALIDNFQIRINLLENVIQQVNEINQLKNEYHEEII